jgi:hypothetical protein
MPKLFENGEIQELQIIELSLTVLFPVDSPLIDYCP